MPFKKFALAAAFAATALSPVFAQAADPCVVITELDAGALRHNDGYYNYISTITRTKRIVDYRAGLVTMQTTIDAYDADGGSAAALQTKSFEELGKEAAAALKNQKPSNCQP